MHIVFVGMYPHEDVNTGGIGIFIQTLSGMLVRNGYEVTVISATILQQEQTEIIDGVKVIRVFSKKSRYLNGVYNILSNVRLLRRIHKQHPIDIIEAAEAGLAYLKMPGTIKKVIRLHGGHYFFAKLLSLPLQQKSAFLERASFSKADFFIGVTNYVMELTSHYLPMEQSKRIIINYPVDCNKFYKADTAKQIPYSIVFAGTVTEKKGIRQLVMALPQIIARFPHAKLDIYGPDWQMADHTSYIDYLQTFIGTDLKQHVFFHGQIANHQLPAVYEAAHLCAFPSHMETQGIVVLEAMSMGKAVLFSTTGPGPETIDHLKDGLIADPYSPDDIAEKIIHLFSHPGLELELGHNAREKMLKKHSLPVITKQNMEFYERIIKG